MDERGAEPLSYDRDVRAWAYRQAALLRQSRFQSLDVEKLAEEIESLGRAQASILHTCYRNIAVILLKALCRPGVFTLRRRGAILKERFDAESCLRASPSLERCRAEIFDAAYRQARKLAAAETGLPLKTFPVDPPFTLDELSSEDYTPWPVPDA